MGNIHLAAAEEAAWRSYLAALGMDDRDMWTGGALMVAVRQHARERLDRAWTAWRQAEHGLAWDAAASARQEVQTWLDVIDRVDAAMKQQ